MRIVLIIILGFFLSLCSMAQQNAKENSGSSTPSPTVTTKVLTEVLIGIPNLKPEQFNSVKSSLKSVKGVTWAGYCEDQSVVFLLVNRAVQSDNKLITDVLLDINKNFTIYFMKNSFNEELNNCRDKDKVMKR